MQGLRSRLAYLVWDVQPRVSAVIVSYTSVELSLGRWLKLQDLGGSFFPLGSLWAQKGGRGKNQQSEKQDDKSDRFWTKLLALLRSASDEAAVLDGA